MKKFATICALSVLAACSQADTSTEAEAPAEAAEAAGWTAAAGTYEYKLSDGASGVNTLAADGTYSNAVTGGEVETGAWGPEDGLTCFTPEGGDGKRCYTLTEPDEEGNFTGERPDGVTLTGRKTA